MRATRLLCTAVLAIVVPMCSRTGQEAASPGASSPTTPVSAPGVAPLRDPQGMANPTPSSGTVGTVAPSGSQATNAALTNFDPGLVAALRKGGYVLYFRHATAEVCQDVEPLGKADTTEKPGWWKSCERDCPNATARQLDARGIGEAKQLGVDLRRLKVPVGRIVTSEFCRAQETGRLMALRKGGKPLPIESSKELTSFVYDEANRCANTYKLLAVTPKVGTNTVLIGHKGNECPIVGSLDSASVAIFKPGGPEGPRAVAVLKAADWARY